MKCGGVEDFINLVESRTPLILDRVKDSIDFGRVKDFINLVESRTPLKCGGVKESINLVESESSKTCTKHL